MMLFFATTAMAQTRPGYTQAAGGIQYKIISKGGGAPIENGQFVELSVISLLERPEGDTVLNNTGNSGANVIVKVDLPEMPPVYLDIFQQLKPGDSVSTRTFTDSIFQTSPESRPPFMKKGAFLVTNFRVIHVFKTEQEANQAKKAIQELREKEAEKHAALQLIKDDRILQEYLEKNKIKAEKNSAGVYIETITAGTGIKSDSTKFATINYTGKTLDGKIFDSNTDPSKGHVEPLKINLTNDPTLGSEVIRGMTLGLRGLGKGAKVNLYIPSSLAYGPTGVGTDVAPDAILIFETQILSVLPAPKSKNNNLLKSLSRLPAKKKPAASGKKNTDINKKKPATRK